MSIDNIGSDFVEISWIAKWHTTNLNRYEVYASDLGDVFDTYQIRGMRLGGGARKMYVIKNIWQLSCRVRGLTPETPYSIGVVVIANGGKLGYSQELFTTDAAEEIASTVESGEVDGNA